jgi:mRNA-degrading endonuclease RelE of RelBE toxin-antitoxin system
MSYKIITTHLFDKELKRLAKKHRSIKNDLAQLGEQLQHNPIIGDKIIENCYKIRIALSGSNKGKSSGARLITYIYIAKKTVFLLSIYIKNEQENISDSELKELVKNIE